MANALFNIWKIKGYHANDGVIFSYGEISEYLDNEIQKEINENNGDYQIVDKGEFVSIIKSTGPADDALDPHKESLNRLNGIEYTNDLFNEKSISRKSLTFIVNSGELFAISTNFGSSFLNKRHVDKLFLKRLLFGSAQFFENNRDYTILYRKHEEKNIRNSAKLSTSAVEYKTLMEFKNYDNLSVPNNIIFSVRGSQPEDYIYHFPMLKKQVVFSIYSDHVVVNISTQGSNDMNLLGALLEICKNEPKINDNYFQWYNEIDVIDDEKKVWDILNASKENIDGRDFSLFIPDRIYNGNLEKNFTFWYSGNEYGIDSDDLKEIVREKFLENLEAGIDGEIKKVNFTISENGVKTTKKCTFMELISLEILESKDGNTYILSSNVWYKIARESVISWERHYQQMLVSDVENELPSIKKIKDTVNMYLTPNSCLESGEKVNEINFNHKLVENADNLILGDHVFLKPVANSSGSFELFDVAKIKENEWSFYHVKRNDSASSMVYVGEQGNFSLENYIQKPNEYVNDFIKEYNKKAKMKEKQYFDENKVKLLSNVKKFNKENIIPKAIYFVIVTKKGKQVSLIAKQKFARMHQHSMDRSTELKIIIIKGTTLGNCSKSKTKKVAQK